jgi:DNA-binding response OmpR family regulator
MTTILIVDDEPGHTRSLKLGLQGKGYRIKSALDGRTALSLLKNNRHGIDIVITDYAMPGMDGLQLLKQIRNCAIYIPVVMMTAHGEKSLIIEALRNRCDSFIEKPFTLEELTTEIENVEERMACLSGSNKTHKHPAAS